MILSCVFFFHWGPSWLSPFRPYLGFAKKGSLTLRIALLSTTVLGFCLWRPLSRHPPQALVRFGSVWYDLVLSGITLALQPEARRPGGPRLGGVVGGWAPVAATGQLGPKSLNRNVGLVLNKL